MTPPGADRFRAFVTRHTRLRPVPHVPEITLHLADELTPLWEMTEEQLGEADVPPPFWAFAWAGGQALARFVLDSPAEVAGRRVLDLATGSGLCAIAAARAGAADVLAADTDPFAVAAAELNAAACAVDLTVTTDDLLAEPVPAVDVVLAGDVCYEHGMARRFLGWLREAHQLGARVLLGDPGRTYLPEEGLRRLATYDVPTSPEVEESDFKRAGVFTFT